MVARASTLTNESAEDLSFDVELSSEQSHSKVHIIHVHSRVNFSNTLSHHFDLGVVVVAAAHHLLLQSSSTTGIYCARDFTYQFFFVCECVRARMSDRERLIDGFPRALDRITRFSVSRLAFVFLCVVCSVSSVREGQQAQAPLSAMCIGQCAPCAGMGGKRSKAE